MIFRCCNRNLRGDVYRSGGAWRGGGGWSGRGEVGVWDLVRSGVAAAREARAMMKANCSAGNTLARSFDHRPPSQPICRLVGLNWNLSKLRLASHGAAAYVHSLNVPEEPPKIEGVNSVNTADLHGYNE
jgi:hypothetical protein